MEKKMDRDIKAYKYGIQSPYISFIPLTEEMKRKIYLSSLKVWKYFLEKIGYEYYPVLTIFAKEDTVKNLKRYVEPKRCWINSDCRPCIESIISIFREFDLIREPLDFENCSEMKRTFIILLIRLEEIRKDKQLIGKIFNYLKHACRLPDKLEIIKFTLEALKKNVVNTKKYISKRVPNFCKMSAQELISDRKSVV